MRYLRHFDSQEDYDAFIRSLTKDQPVIGSGPSGIHMHAVPTIDYSKVAMFFENVDDKAVTIGVEKYGGEKCTATLQVSMDGKTWEDWDSTSTTPLTRTLQNKGDKLYIRATTNVGYFCDEDNFNYFNSDGKVNVGGNIMSLGYKDFEDKTSITHIYAYVGVFYDMTNIIDASKLVLPATELASDCYESMFGNCTSLIAAPELPATKLAEACYGFMFENCTSLTTAPELPATTLAEACYHYMFKNCTSLTTAPELPATEVERECYQHMFENCTSLTTAPELPATKLGDIYATSGEYCYKSMFKGCTSLTTAPELPATKLAWSCYDGMFQNCTSLTTAPVLPATTLLSHCYNGMFSGCSSLNYIKAMFITTFITESSNVYIGNWVKGVASTGTFVKNAAATWDVTGVSGIPSGWDVETATA